MIKGSHHSPQTKQKISTAKTGVAVWGGTRDVPWMLGNKHRVGHLPWNTGLDGIHLSPTTEFKKGQTPWNKGKSFPDMRGEKHPNWNPNKSPDAHLKRSFQYKTWHRQVMVRDDYTCQACGKRGGSDLQVDHELPWALYPDLRFEVLNGRVLCKPCHRKTPTFGTRLKKFAKAFTI